jgi:hypothetical protein
MAICFAVGCAKEINFFAEFDQLPRLARLRLVRGCRFTLTKEIQDFLGTPGGEQIVYAVDERPLAGLW